MECTTLNFADKLTAYVIKDFTSNLWLGLICKVYGTAQVQGKTLNLQIVRTSLKFG